MPVGFAMVATMDHQPRARYGRLLALAEFRAIFAAHVVSTLGDVVASVALTVLVYERSRSSALAAAVFALAFVPYLLTGGLATRLVRRFPARPVLVACDLISAVLAAAMTVPGLPVAVLLLMTFGLGLVAPVFAGVRSAVLPDVLPPGAPYILGRSLMRVVSQGAQLGGYAAGGVLLAVTGPRAALAADALSFAAAAATVRFGTTLRRPRGRSGPARQTLEPSPATAARASWRLVLGDRRRRRLLLLGWLIPACAVAPEALAAPYVAHLGLPAGDTGYFLCGLPTGAIVADVVAGRFLSLRTQRRILAASAAFVFVPLMAFAARPGLVASILVLTAGGLGFAYSAGLDGAIIDATSEESRPATLATYTAGLMFAQGVSFSLWGLAAELLAPAVVIQSAALVGLLVVALLGPGAGGDAGGRHRWRCGRPAPGTAR